MMNKPRALVTNRGSRPVKDTGGIPIGISQIPDDILHFSNLPYRNFE